MTWLQRLFPCSGCQLRDDAHYRIVKAKDAEIARYVEREKALMKECHELASKLSAHADISAHVSAERAAAERERAEQGVEPRQKRRGSISGPLPPFAGSLAGKGHLSTVGGLRAFRQRAQPKVVLEPGQMPQKREVAE